MLELQKIVGRVLQKKGNVLLPLPFEAHERFLEEFHTTALEHTQKPVVFRAVTERESEMSRVELGKRIDLVGSQMAHDLIAEEVQRDAIVIPPRKTRPDFLDIELFCFIQVPAGNG